MSQCPHDIMSTPTPDLLFCPAFPAPFTQLLYTKIWASSSTSLLHPPQVSTWINLINAILSEKEIAAHTHSKVKTFHLQQRLLLETFTVSDFKQPKLIMTKNSELFLLELPDPHTDVRQQTRNMLKWAEDLCISKDDIHVTNKHIKRSLTPLVIRQRKSKAQ